MCFCYTDIICDIIINLALFRIALGVKLIAPHLSFIVPLVPHGRHMEPESGPIRWWSITSQTWRLCFHLFIRKCSYLLSPPCELFHFSWKLRKCVGVRLSWKFTCNSEIQTPLTASPNILVRRILLWLVHSIADAQICCQRNQDDLDVCICDCACPVVSWKKSRIILCGDSITLYISVLWAWKTSCIGEP